MKDITLHEINARRLDSQEIIRRTILEFFQSTGLPLYVDTITRTTETRSGTVVGIEVEAKVIIN